MEVCLFSLTPFPFLLGTLVAHIIINHAITLPIAYYYPCSKLIDCYSSLFGFSQLFATYLFGNFIFLLFSIVRPKCDNEPDLFVNNSSLARSKFGQSSARCSSARV